MKTYRSAKLELNNNNKKKKKKKKWQRDSSRFRSR